MIKEIKQEGTQKMVARIALSTGGTGGHVFPAICLAEELVKRGYHVSWCIDQRGEKYINPDAVKQPDKLIFNIAKGSGIIGAISQFVTIFTSTLKVLRSFVACRPNLVVGFGGYTTAPVVVAAKLLGIPIVLHEQNAVLGKVNRWMARYAEIMALGFEQTQRIPQGLKTVCVGNPVRADIMQLREKRYPVVGEKLKILIIGGSQGAALFSRVVPEAILLLPESLQSRIEITQQARQELLESTQLAYQRLGVLAVVQPFFNNMADLYAETHLVICRAGAMTVAEVYAAHRPAIFVPLAIAMDNHQYFNAAELANTQSGWVIEEKEFTPHALAVQLQELLENPGLLKELSQKLEKKYRPDATVTLANYLEDLLPKRK